MEKQTTAKKSNLKTKKVSIPWQQGTRNINRKIKEAAEQQNYCD